MTSVLSLVHYCASFVMFCHVCRMMCIDADIDTEDIDTRDVDGDWYWHHQGTHWGEGKGYIHPGKVNNNHKILHWAFCTLYVCIFVLTNSFKAFSSDLKCWYCWCRPWSRFCANKEIKSNGSAFTAINSLKSNHFYFDISADVKSPNTISFNCRMLPVF